MFWLPRTTLCSHEEAVDLVLRHRHGLAAEQRRPAWVAEFGLPAVAGLRGEIEGFEADVRAAEEALTRAQEHAAYEARYDKLLYETGEHVLEPVVRDALRALGAEVIDPQVRGREDGRLTYPAGSAGRAMLEVKGRKGALRLSDVRQLDQWVRDERVSWPSKGVLLANCWNEQRPGERSEVFPENAVSFAERAGICLATTTQVYEGLRRHQRGELDADAFFAELLRTDGVCGLQELEDGPHED